MGRGKNAIAGTLAVSPNLDHAHEYLVDGNILYKADHSEKKKIIKFRAAILAQSLHLTDEETKA